MGTHNTMTLQRYRENINDLINKGASAIRGVTAGAWGDQDDLEYGVQKFEGSSLEIESNNISFTVY